MSVLSSPYRSEERGHRAHVRSLPAHGWERESYRVDIQPGQLNCARCLTRDRLRSHCNRVGRHALQSHAQWRNTGPATTPTLILRHVVDRLETKVIQKEAVLLQELKKRLVTFPAAILQRLVRLSRVSVQIGVRRVEECATSWRRLSDQEHSDLFRAITASQFFDCHGDAILRRRRSFA